MLTVGIDPHKKTHTAVLVDERGHRVGHALKVADSPEAAAKLITWVAKYASGRSVRFAIEDGRGLARRLANTLVTVGQEVWWVPVRLMAEKRRKNGRRGKSDPIDAEAAAKAAMDPDNARYLSPHRVDEIGRDLRYLVDDRRENVTGRTALINRLRWRLHEYDPSLDPASLITVKAPRQLIDTLSSQPASVLRDALIRGCEDLLRMTGRINELTRDITIRVTDMAPTLLARHGVGPIVAATIIGELGDPARVRNGAALARLAGLAPIPVWTSNNQRHRLDRAGNRMINAAVHTVALAQARGYAKAKKLITKNRDAKGFKGAMRILKRHLADAIYHDLMIDFGPTTSTS
jgi:transposase